MICRTTTLLSPDSLQSRSKVEAAIPQTVQVEQRARTPIPRKVENANHAPKVADKNPEAPRAVAQLPAEHPMAAQPSAKQHEVGQSLKLDHQAAAPPVPAKDDKTS